MAEIANKSKNIDSSIEINPSPSNNEWFKNSANLEEIERSIDMLREGKTKDYSVKELKDLLEE